MEKDTKKIENLVSLMFTLQRIVRQNGTQYKKLDPHMMLRIAVLKFIEEKGDATMKDIADYLNITAPSATSLVSNLVNSGFALREKSKKDMRITRIYVSKKGEDTIKEMMDCMGDKMKRVFSKLSEKEVNDFIKILEHLKEVNE